MIKALLKDASSVTHFDADDWTFDEQFIRLIKTDVGQVALINVNEIVWVKKDSELGRGDG